MEKDDEVAGNENSYTATFWQYDPRLGKRWNIDPVVKPNESPYATFANNPIWFADPSGADTTFTTAEAKEDFDEVYEEVQNRLNSLFKDVMKLRDRAKRKGWSEEKFNKKYEKKYETQMKGLSGILVSMNEIIESKTEFVYTKGETGVGHDGSTVYNDCLDQVLISFETKMALVHENRHGSGWLHGEWNSTVINQIYNKDGSVRRYFYIMTDYSKIDEQVAFRAAQIYDPNEMSKKLEEARKKNRPNYGSYSIEMLVEDEYEKKGSFKNE